MNLLASILLILLVTIAAENQGQYEDGSVSAESSTGVKQVQYFDAIRKESENIATPSWPSNDSSKRFYKDHPQFIVKYKSKDGKQRANKRAKDRVKNGKASSRYIEDLDHYVVQIVEIDTIDELQAFEEDEDVDFVEESKFPSNTQLLLLHCII